MSQAWFPIQTKLIDRQDLTLHEKMCSIVMARYADRDEFEHLLTLEAISKKMGCTPKEVEKALLGLMQKGLLDVEDAGSTHILHQPEDIRIQPALFEELTDEEESMDAGASAPEVSPATDGGPLPGASPISDRAPVLAQMQASEVSEVASKAKVASVSTQASTSRQGRPKLSKASKAEVRKASEEKGPTKSANVKTAAAKEKKLEQVYAILDEKINAKEARLLLAFAGDDPQRLEACYHALKTREYHGDVVDALIERLQQSEPDAGADATARTPGRGKTGPKTAPQTDVSQARDTARPGERSSAEDGADTEGGAVAEGVKPPKGQPVESVNTRGSAGTVVPGQINLVNLNKMKLYQEMVTQSQQIQKKKAPK